MLDENATPGGPEVDEPESGENKDITALQSMFSSLKTFRNSRKVPFRYHLAGIPLAYPSIKAKLQSESVPIDCTEPLSDRLFH